MKGLLVFWAYNFLLQILSLVNGGLVGYNLVLLRDREFFQSDEQDESSHMQPMQSKLDFLNL